MDSQKPVKITQFNSNAPKVPYYHEHERIRRNRLAENEVKRYYIPDVGNDEQKKELEESMIAGYDMVNLERPFDVFHDDQHRFYSTTITTFLEEIGVNWESILFCFLAERERTQNILAIDRSQRIVGGLLLVLDKEKDDHQIQYELSRKKWVTVLEKKLRMYAPTAQELTRSIIAMKQFRLQRNLSLWHFTRRSEVALKLLESVLPKANLPNHTQDGQFSYSNVTCPICRSTTFCSAPSIFHED